MLPTMLRNLWKLHLVLQRASWESIATKNLTSDPEPTSPLPQSRSLLYNREKRKKDKVVWTLEEIIYTSYKMQGSRCVISNYVVAGSRHKWQIHLTDRNGSCTISPRFHLTLLCDSCPWYSVTLNKRRGCCCLPACLLMASSSSHKEAIMPARAEDACRLLDCTYSAQSAKFCVSIGSGG